MIITSGLQFGQSGTTVAMKTAEFAPLAGVSLHFD